MEESTEKRDRPHEKYVRNPENIPYYEAEKTHQRINKKDKNKQQFDKDGEVIDSSDDGFKQPSDQDEQGNVLTTDKLVLNGMDKSNYTLDKQDTKPAAEQEEQETPPSPLRNTRHHPHSHETHEDSENKMMRLKR
jgi:hypothetical protein